MPKKMMTIDSLAAMVKRGFDEAAKKRDLDEIKRDIGGMRDRLGRVQEKIDNIEKLILQTAKF